MADHVLIDAYLATLAGRLPADAVDELADGLAETYQRNQARGLDAHSAATTAIAEFGRPAEVTTAFVRNAPGRRIAIRLLATAPVFAALWGATLITAQAWTWSVPVAAAPVFAICLATIAGSLLVVVTCRLPSRTRLATPAGTGLILLDLGMLTTLVIADPGPTWPMAPAVAASLIRVVLTARALTHALAGRR